MKRLLKIMLKNDVFKNEKLPDSSNKRFFPRKSTIRNHMIHARRKLCHSLIDQECLTHKIDKWKKKFPASNIFFRPKGIMDNNSVDATKDSTEDKDEVKLESGTETSLLFVYQSDWQSRLPSRYGNELVLLDATYRTTRYALPLFLLVVKTNIDYQIAATFVTENEKEESIVKALEIIKTWNPELHPRYGMTDYCIEEISAMEKVFPGMESIPF